MTETQTLWLILAVVYAIECVCWLRSDALGFRTWLGRRWRVVRPAQIAGNYRGGFIPVAPLPPLGTILVANPLPVALAPEGFATEHGLFRWEDASSLEVANKKLQLNGRIVCLCGSNAHAASLARELRGLAKLKPEARATAIRALLRRNLDVKEVRE